MPSALCPQQLSCAIIEGMKADFRRVCNRAVRSVLEQSRHVCLYLSDCWEVRDLFEFDLFPISDRLHIKLLGILFICLFYPLK